MSLNQSLVNFQQKANANLRVQRIATGWSQRLVVECCDTDQRYCIEIRDGRLSDVQVKPISTNDGCLLIRGQEDLLTRIFNGAHHPLTAYNDGELEVYGEQRDQVKLDAISLVMWGA
jgi:hypothetical protein